jgi:predicted DNA-binding transcriptional regulator AlpA
MSTTLELPDAYLTGERVRQLFGISEETLRNWLKAKKLPTPVRIGNRCYFDPREFHDFLERNRQTQTTQNAE